MLEDSFLLGFVREPSDKTSMSRRDFFRRLLLKEPILEAKEDPPENTTDPDSVAVIQGKFCLAYQGESCTRCFDTCPENGAIELHEGLPMVNTDFCTGCRDCQNVCPAEADAILMVPRIR
jgi:Pyruvate/2-oxoacid:ferredoxin oxidoreductase delta subunit